MSKKLRVVLSLALLSSGLPTFAGGQTMLDGLQKSYETRCGGVAIALWHSPTSEVAHFTDNRPEQFDKYRIVISVTNVTGPADRTFAFTAPKPPAQYFSIFRKSGSAYVDITEEQIDPFHTGSSLTQNVRFEGVGDVFYSVLTYTAFTTIASGENLSGGDYAVRIRPYEIVTTDGQSCTLEAPDLFIKVR